MIRNNKKGKLPMKGSVDEVGSSTGIQRNHDSAYWSAIILLKTAMTGIIFWSCEDG